MASIYSTLLLHLGAEIFLLDFMLVRSVADIFIHTLKSTTFKQKETHMQYVSRNGNAVVEVILFHTER